MRPAATIAACIPIDPNDALSGIDNASISLAVQATHHANDQRPTDHRALARLAAQHEEIARLRHDLQRAATIRRLPAPASPAAPPGKKPTPS